MTSGRVFGGPAAPACVDPAASASLVDRLRSDLKSRSAMLDASADCIKLLDMQGRLVGMNAAGREALGVTDEQADAGYGMYWLDLLPPGIARRGRKALAAACAGGSARFPGESVDPHGTRRYWDNMLTPIADEDGQFRTIMCVSRDVTAQRTADEKLRRASERDGLTSLLNRRAFEKRARRVVASARPGSQAGVAIIDVDHFKHVNDAFGHAAGDRVLKTVAHDLLRKLPANAVIGRLGGDEFVVALRNVRDRAHLVELLTTATGTAKGSTRYSTSVGCAIVPDDGSDLAALLSSADSALATVKESCRGGLAVFTSSMSNRARDDALQLEIAREVLRRESIVPVYQRCVRLDTGAVVGCEALLRWSDGSDLMPPSALETAFDDFELAGRLGQRMQELVMADLAAWRATWSTGVPVAINVAPIELIRDAFAEDFLARASQAGVPTSAVRIEVTERALGTRGVEVVARNLAQLRASGVEVYLDDFVMGHSSLARLTDMPIDGLKIDRAFVQRLGSDPTAFTIVSAIASLGQALDLAVIAEGIETEEQRDLVRKAGCSLGQGNLFGAPETGRVAARAASRRRSQPSHRYGVSVPSRPMSS
jgi:diguanylate cyclase (GGDEF)-like protein/PAS domain S-box-containing protein